MRDVIVALQVIVPLVLVLAIYARTMRNQGQLIARVHRDDWRGARATAASEIIGRESRWIPRAVRAQATQLVGVAHLVLGDLPQARSALEHALATQLRALGALGHLREVDEARWEIDGLR